MPGDFLPSQNVGSAVNDFKALTRNIPAGFLAASQRAALTRAHDTRDRRGRVSVHSVPQCVKARPARSRQGQQFGLPGANPGPLPLPRSGWPKSGDT